MSGLDIIASEEGVTYPPRPPIQNEKTGGVDDHEKQGKGSSKEVPLLAYVDKNVVVDKETSKRLFHMVNKRVLPPMLFAYLLQGLTKGALSPASIMGLQEDTNMGGEDFALANALLYVGLIAAQIPVNRVNQMLPLGYLLSFSMVSWGVVLLIMGFMRDRKPIFALRLILGICQALFGPCLLRMNTMWYTTQEQPIVTAAFQSFIGVASIILALLGYGFYYVQAKALYSWQYMFVVIALMSIVCGVYTLFTLPNSPIDSKYYSEKDKLLLVERVRENDQGISNKEFKRDQAIEALWDPVSWMLGVMLLITGIICGGIGTFQNILLNQDFGFDVQNSQLLTIPPGILIIATYMTSGWIVRKTHETYYTMLLFTIFPIAGNIIMSTVQTGPRSKYILLIGYWFLCSFGTMNPMNYMLLSRNVAGQTKKTVIFTINFAFVSAGNVIGPLLFASSWAPRYLPTMHIHSVLMVIFIVLAIWSRTLLVKRNRTKLRQQRASGATEGTHLLAFEDLTDVQNPEFRYSL